MQVAVEKKLFVVHLCILCQKLFMPLSAEELGKYWEEEAISGTVA